MNNDRLVENINEVKEVMSSEERREKAMQSYLNDVAPISEFINQGFKAIDDNKLNGNGDNNIES